MGRLSRTDLERALRFAALVGEQAGPGDASDRTLIDALWKMIDTEYASYERVDEGRRAWLTQVTLSTGLPPESIDEDALQLGWQQDPFIRYRRRTGDFSAVRHLKLGVSNRTAALARTGRSHPVLVRPNG